jgi:phosphatidylserine decarboxylase
MKRPSAIDSVFQQEQINFILTNRIPRRLLTLLMGWFSQIEHPIVRDLSMTVWKFFAGDLDLSEARKTRFTSLHDCFIRELRPGARPIDARQEVVVSPCDGIVTACASVLGTTLVQAKGLTYTLEDLLGDPSLVATYRDGHYVTLRLRSSMYHRFHAPCDGAINGVTYFSGDTWNVNPAALRRIERLYCKNERAVLRLMLEGSEESIALVPVAAILVASIHLNFLDVALNLRYKGPNRIPCRASFKKGDEMGHFRHGSTIIVFATRGFALCDGVREGDVVRMGEPLFVADPRRVVTAP